MKKNSSIFPWISSLFLLLVSQVAPGAPSQDEIRDAILERVSLTDAELQSMDLNKDGIVDVADLIKAAYPLPLVSFAEASSEGKEGEGAINIALQASAPLHAPVSYSLRRLTPAPGTETVKTIEFSGTEANISFPLPDDADETALGQTVIWQLGIKGSSENYVPGVTQSHTLLVHDNDGLWYGSLTTADNINIPLLLQIVQFNGTITGKLLSDKNNGMISEEQAAQAQVTIALQPQEFQAEIKGIEIPTTTSWANIPYQRRVTLTSTEESGQSFDLNEARMLLGNFTEFLSVDEFPFLNRTQEGVFVLLKQAPVIEAPIPELIPSL